MGWCTRIGPLTSERGRQWLLLALVQASTRSKRRTGYINAASAAFFLSPARSASQIRKTAGAKQSSLRAAAGYPVDKERTWLTVLAGTYKFGLALECIFQSGL